MTRPEMESLIEALTSSLDSIQNYFDRDTGEVVAISDEFGASGLEGRADRYLPITSLTASERFQIMEDFVETLGNEDLEDELNQALIEKGAFLRFEEVLSKYPTRFQAWKKFRTDRMMSLARAWLEERGIRLPG